MRAKAVYAACADRDIRLGEQNHHSDGIASVPFPLENGTIAIWAAKRTRKDSFRFIYNENARFDMAFVDEIISSYDLTDWIAVSTKATRENETALTFHNWGFQTLIPIDVRISRKQNSYHHTRFSVLYPGYVFVKYDDRIFEAVKLLKKSFRVVRNSRNEVIRIKPNQIKTILEWMRDKYLEFVEKGRWFSGLIPRASGKFRAGDRAVVLMGEFRGSEVKVLHFDGLTARVRYANEGLSEPFQIFGLFLGLISA